MSHSAPSTAPDDVARVRLAREQMPLILKALESDDWDVLTRFSARFPRTGGVPGFSTKSSQRDDALMMCWNIIVLTSASEGALETWVQAMERLVPVRLPDTDAALHQAIYVDEHGEYNSYVQIVRFVDVVARGFLPIDIVLRIYRCLSRLLVIYAYTGIQRLDKMARRRTSTAADIAEDEIILPAIGTVLVLMRTMLDLFLRAPELCLPIWDEEGVVPILFRHVRLYAHYVHSKGSLPKSYDETLAYAPIQLAAVYLLYDQELPLSMHAYIPTFGPYTWATLPSQPELRHYIGTKMGEAHFGMTSKRENNVCGNCGRVAQEQKELRRCSACRMQLVCSAACQKEAWKNGHKANCSKLWLKNKDD